MFPVRDTIPSRHFPIMTLLLIIGNLYVFYHELTLGPKGLEIFINKYALIPLGFSFEKIFSTNLTKLQSLFTSMFIHGGFFHLISNLWTLWIFGDNVEDRMGPLKFFLFYIFCGIVSALLHIYTNQNSLVPTIGASGAIAGVMGAYFLMYPRASIVVMFPIIFYPVFFQVPAFFYLGFWFFGQFQAGLISLGQDLSFGGIAWWAHIGGFVAGMFFYRRFSFRY